MIGSAALATSCLGLTESKATGVSTSPTEKGSKLRKPSATVWSLEGLLTTS